MNTAITFSNESPKVFFKDGRLVTTSQAVADYFDKQHKHVLAKIDTLDCSPEFTSANFSADVQTVEIGNGAERESRCYLITKDGFMFLVMGFTGKKAARLKEAYIEKFNAMEEELHKRPPAAQNSPAPNNGCALLFTSINTVRSSSQKKSPPMRWYARWNGLNFIWSNMVDRCP